MSTKAYAAFVRDHILARTDAEREAAKRRYAQESYDEIMARAEQHAPRAASTTVDAGVKESAPQQRVIEVRNGVSLALGH